MRSHVTMKIFINKGSIPQFQYRKRYEITCDKTRHEARMTALDAFQYRKRYEITCDSVSGRPQKQKAQNAVLENLLKAEHAIAYFRLSLHTPRLCNDPAAPCIARLATI